MKKKKKKREKKNPLPSCIVTNLLDFPELNPSFNKLSLGSFPPETEST